MGYGLHVSLRPPKTYHQITYSHYLSPITYYLLPQSNALKKIKNPPHMGRVVYTRGTTQLKSLTLSLDAC
jgi:hypothetical protein